MTRQDVRDALAMLYGDSEYDRNEWRRVSTVFDDAWPDAALVPRPEPREPPSAPSRPLEEAIERLIAQWRGMCANANAEGPIPFDESGHAARWTAVEMCADELDRLRVLVPGGDPQEP